MQKRTLITGASGFLGKIIHQKLLSKKIQVISLSRSKHSSISCDLSNQIPKIKSSLDSVIHCAGLAHVENLTNEISDRIWQTNVLGTKNLLRGIENTNPKHFILISSVSVYGLEKGKNIHESTRLKADDNYGKSKLKQEFEVKEWCKNRKVPLTILRLPLVVGNNPPGNLGKMIRAIRRGYYFNINNGKARRSMVLADDVANIIINLKTEGVYNLTDGCHPSFEELSNFIKKKIKGGRVWNINEKYIRILINVIEFFPFNFPINSKIISKMTKDLIFCDKKAKNYLGWKPNSVLKKWDLK